MKKNIVILVISLIFLGLTISNLYLIRKNLELNEKLTVIYELQASISTLKAQHQQEIEEIKADYNNQLKQLNEEYAEKYDTVEKTLNAFEYEIEEFYKNKFIVKQDYLENIKKINDVREKVEESKESMKDSN